MQMKKFSPLQEKATCFTGKMLFLSFLLFLAVAWSGCASAPPVPPQRARALELERKGVESFRAGRYEKAGSYFQKALEANELIDRREGVAQNLNNLGTVYQALGYTSRAKEYYRKALAIHSNIFLQIQLYLMIIQSWN